MSHRAALPVVISLCLACLLLPACTGLQSQQLVSDGGDDPGEVHVETLLDDLDEPWGMDFLPDGRLLLTEKSGRLLAVDVNRGTTTEIQDPPASVSVGQGGLMDVAVHPDFERNSLVYLSYSIEQQGLYSTRVSRARLRGERLVEHLELFTAVPFFSQRRHFGSRLLLDGDYLYITVGDRANRDLAQSLATHNGKVIRLHADGSVPDDNPFVGRADALPEIFTYGHRNPQGLARHPDSGALWSAEHGPRGGDEINELRAGANYGWPVITYGQEYAGGSIGEGTAKPGMEQPLAYYPRSIGTAGMDFYSGDAYPQWPDSLLLAGLRGTHISRRELQGSGLGEPVAMLGKLNMRFRDVQLGPDGLVYALAGGSRLLRLQPRR